LKPSLSQRDEISFTDQIQLPTNQL